MADDGGKDVTLSIHVPHFVTATLDRIPGANWYLKWWISLLYENPVHLLIETTLILLILYILIQRPNRKQSKLDTLPPQVVQELINDYEPEPLCPPLSETAQQILQSTVLLEERPAKYTKLEGKTEKLLNLVTMDFLGFGQRIEVEEAASAALDKYGCGSCGPRGFYGSIDVHVVLERDLAKFFKTEECIVYSDASSAPTSALPAFSNRADLLVVDDGVNDAVMTGVNLSRSRVLFFKHNDIEDLKRVLLKVQEEDKRVKRKPQRRFIVVEGLYRNFGDVAPLDTIVELKNKCKWRLFVDESHAIGVFGANGRGVTEHFGIPPSEVDLLVGSLSTALTSVGGFCVGTREVVEHQRLSGAGYCFSASSPPFVSTAASAAIKLLESEGKDKLLRTIKRNAQRVHAKLLDDGQGILLPISNPASALVHVRLDSAYRATEAREDYDDEKRAEEEKILRNIITIYRDQGFLATVANYIVTTEKKADKIGGSEKPPLAAPSIRLSITALHEEDELDSAVTTLVKSAKKALLAFSGLQTEETNGNERNDQHNGELRQRRH